MYGYIPGFRTHIIVRYKAGGFLLNLISVKVGVSKVVVQRTPVYTLLIFGLVFVKVYLTQLITF